MEFLQKTVLLVDDDSDARMLFACACKRTKTSFALRLVENGEEAVAYLMGLGDYADRTRHPLPDLVVLDLNMPRMNGFEVLSWMRGQRQLTYLPVIVFSASQLDHDMRRAYSLHANSYLVKPHGMEELVGAVNAIESYWLRLHCLPDKVALSA